MLQNIIKMKKIKVGIFGGAGYTGGELLRILLNHSAVEIVFVHSKSSAGQLISAIHTDLLGDTDLQFTDTITQDFTQNIDVIFLCVGHNEAAKLVNQYQFAKSVKCIDLSQDHRLANANFVYGLPELNREQIKTAQNIANPGCFATCIQLALLPLAAMNLLKNDIHISATTGSTGAGQALSTTSQFSWRQNNLSTYKVFEHQHLAEITQSLLQMQANFDSEINFMPHRGSFTRGIFATLYTECELDLQSLLQQYQDFYATHPFVHISSQSIDLKQVVNTNKCLLHITKHNNKIVITSCIDNLLKGASGQAVQNMNLLFGLEETEGLRLKASYF
jgi:N-acetyl-gamma-glutamyl-phosphate reductase